MRTLPSVQWGAEVCGPFPAYSGCPSMRTLSSVQWGAPSATHFTVEVQWMYPPAVSMSSTTWIHSCWFCLISSVHVHSGPCSTSIVQYSQQHEPKAETAERITFRIATWWSLPSVLCLGRAPFSSSICRLIISIAPNCWCRYLSGSNWMLDVKDPFTKTRQLPFNITRQYRS